MLYTILAIGTLLQAYRCSPAVWLWLQTYTATQRLILLLNYPVELCFYSLFNVAAIEVFWLLPRTCRLLPGTSRLWSGHSGSTRLTWSASCLYRYMHSPLLLPAGPPVFEKLMTCCHNEPTLSKHAVLVKENLAILQQPIVAQSNLQSWVASVHKHDKHVHGFSQLRHGEYHAQ